MIELTACYSCEKEERYPDMNKEEHFWEILTLTEAWRTFYLHYCTILDISLKKNSKEQVQRGNKNGEENCKPICQTRLGKLNLIENNCLKVWCTMMKGAQFKGDKFFEGNFKKSL